MKNHHLLTLLVLFIGTGLFHSSAHGQNFYKEKIPRKNFLQAGVGLGTIYADNAGSIRKLALPLRPGLSFTYGRKIHKNLDIRANIGYQRYRSQSLDYYSPTIIATWVSNGQAVTSKNNLLYLDVIPSLYLFGSDNHTSRRKINIYGGIGLGLLMNFKQTTNINFEETSHHKDAQLTGYIPFRGGLSYRFDIYTDIAFEGTLMYSFSDKIDGNVGYNRLNDLPLIGQIVIRRYLDPLK